MLNNPINLEGNENIKRVVVAQFVKCVVVTDHEISFQFSLIVQIQQDCNRSHHILEY